MNRPNRDLRIMACCFCKDPLFHKWMLTKLHAVAIICTRNITNEDAAKQFILETCKVSSRNDLDRIPLAAQRFHELVRKPFLEWKEAQP